MFLRWRTCAASGAVLAAATVLTGVTLTGSAAADPSGPTPLSAGQFTLSANYRQFEALDSALMSKVPRVPVHVVLDHANHARKRLPLFWPGRPGGLAPAGLAGGFRFDDTDNTDCTNFPQGITTSRDAVGAANNGNYDGHQLVLVSWYTKDKCKGDGVRSRITLADWDATYPDKYRKILLVEPTGTTKSPSFKDIPIHAGGVSWYGDFLYVADTSRGMRVFDMRKILETDPSSDQIGLHNGKYYAHKYRYVLPQIGTITSHTAARPKLLWSTISLDRANKSIVMTEYTCPDDTSIDCDGDRRQPRAVRFPFASHGVFAAHTTASQVLLLPWRQLNGVASHNGRWWFNSSGDKKLYYRATSGRSTEYSWVPFGESISYWEDPKKPDLLWTLEEGARNRNVFAVQQSTYNG